MKPFELELDLKPSDLVTLPSGAVVMDIDDGIGQPIHVPDGWDLLPGGVERTIGVNRGWFEDGAGAPWRIEVNGQRVESVAEFVPLGLVKSVTTETTERVYDCGKYVNATHRAAWLVTSGPILVKH